MSVCDVAAAVIDVLHVMFVCRDVPCLSVCIYIVLLGSVVVRTSDS